MSYLVQSISNGAPLTIALPMSTVGIKFKQSLFRECCTSVPFERYHLFSSSVSIVTLNLFVSERRDDLTKSFVISRSVYGSTILFHQSKYNDQVSDLHRKESSSPSQELIKQPLFQLSCLVFDDLFSFDRVSKLFQFVHVIYFFSFNPIDVIGALLIDVINAILLARSARLDPAKWIICCIVLPIFIDFFLHVQLFIVRNKIHQ